MRWLLITVAAFLAPESAWACAVCGCGDPTLTSMGSEKLFRGRTRTAFAVTSRSDTIGAPKVSEVRLRELRSELAFVYAPTDWLALSASLPFLWREVTDVALRTDGMVHVGDAEVRAKLIAWQDRDYAPRHILAAQLGVKLPTAPKLIDARGRVAAVELQPGTGSVDGLAGLSYGFFALPWSAYVSATAFVPTRGRLGFQAGKSLRTTSLLQYQLWPSLAARLGLDTRLDAVATVDGAAEPDSGGFIAFTSPELLWSPWTDLVVVAGVRVPTLNALYGEHREGLMFNLGVVYDL